MADIIPIAVINESSLLSDGDIAPMVAAVHEDISTNFGPWDVAATLTQVPKGDPAPSGSWQIVFLDDSDQADALGYHERTFWGQPLGKVFVRTTLQYRQTVSRVFSHETGEMLVDPNLNRVTAPMSDGRIYAIEVGDLLSLDTQGRMVNGQLMSGIALPAAYYPNYGTHYDIGGMLTAPLPSVQPSAGAFLMWQGGSGWACHIPETSDPDEFMAMQAQRGSRRHRRMFPTAWRNSAK